MKCQNEKCNKEHDGSFGSGKFCSRSCANSRTISEKTKQLIQQKIKLWNEKNPKLKKEFEYICEKCGNKFDNKTRIRTECGKRIRCKNCRNKKIIKNINDVDSLLELPGRTVGKILKRMNIGCSNCGWKKSTGDIHHINGKKIKDYNNHKNLCYLCPNCHRLVHNKKIYKENLISLDIFIGNKWKYFYNIKM